MNFLGLGREDRTCRTGLMPKKPKSTPKRNPGKRTTKLDVNQIAFRVVQEATQGK